MLGRALLWAAEKPRIERMVTQGRLTRPVVQRFVAGDRLEDAIAAIQRLNSKNIRGILDLLGEGVSDPAGATAAAQEYLDSIEHIKQTGIQSTVSVKLTQLGLAFDKGACIDHLRILCAQAQVAGTSLEIDMEQSDYVTDTIEVFRLLRTDFPDLRLAIQAYLRRTPVDLEGLAEMPPRIRLVKGAYAEPEDAAYQRRSEIDNQFRFLTDWLFDRGELPGIATHDSDLLEHAKIAAERTGAGRQGFEIQMLYGIRSDLQETLAAHGFRVCVYVPFGSAWYPYLMRRLAERPGNLRFFLRSLARG